MYSDQKILVTVALVFATTVGSTERRKRDDLVALGGPLLLPWQYSNNWGLGPIINDNIVVNLDAVEAGNHYGNLNGLYFQDNQVRHFIQAPDAYNIIQQYPVQYIVHPNSNQDQESQWEYRQGGLTQNDPQRGNRYPVLSEDSPIISSLSLNEGLSGGTEQRQPQNSELIRNKQTPSTLGDNFIRPSFNSDQFLDEKSTAHSHENHIEKERLLDGNRQPDIPVPPHGQHNNELNSELLKIDSSRQITRNNYPQEYTKNDSQENIHPVDGDLKRNFLRSNEASVEQTIRSSTHKNRFNDYSVQNKAASSQPVWMTSSDQKEIDQFLRAQGKLGDNFGPYLFLKQQINEDKPSVITNQIKNNAPFRKEEPLSNSNTKRNSEILSKS